MKTPLATVPSPATDVQPCSPDAQPQFWASWHQGEAYLVRQDWEAAAQSYAEALAHHAPGLPLRPAELQDRIEQCQVALEMQRLIGLGNQAYLQQRWMTATAYFSRVKGLYQAGLGVDEAELTQVIARCEQGLSYQALLRAARQSCRHQQYGRACEEYDRALELHHPDFGPSLEALRQEKGDIVAECNLSRKRLSQGVQTAGLALVLIGTLGLLATLLTGLRQPRAASQGGPGSEMKQPADGPRFQRAVAFEVLPAEEKLVQDGAVQDSVAPLLFAEVMPEFPGGERALNQYLSRNLVYPGEARSMGMEGKVVLRFVVQPNGSLTDLEVLRGVGYGCSREAMRVVSRMPRWRPGQNEGKNVPVIQQLTIDFDL